jgi:hypothetical protein
VGRTLLSVAVDLACELRTFTAASAAVEDRRFSAGEVFAGMLRAMEAIVKYLEELDQGKTS